MSEYVFTPGQISAFTDKLEFSGDRVLHASELTKARIAIAQLLLLEKNPNQVSVVLIALEKISTQPDLHIYFKTPAERIESVHIQEIIDATREVESGKSDIHRLMTNLKSAFRL